MSDEKPTFERRMADHAATEYARRLAGVVESLRRLANEVEREGRPRDRASIDGTPRFSSSAEQALHSLAWGIANLNADRLVSAAACADTYEAQAAAAAPSSGGPSDTPREDA